jgi:uncharacterized protein YlbG (UPF0298 family)
MGKVVRVRLLGLIVHYHLAKNRKNKNLSDFGSIGFESKRIQNLEIFRKNLFDQNIRKKAF